VNEETCQDDQELREELAMARQSLDGLVQDLRTIDRELDGLSTERNQYRLLSEVCGGLEALRDLGVADLFWGDRSAGAQGDDTVLHARGRVDIFEKCIQEIEDRRQALIDDLEQQQENTEILEDDVFEAQEREEQRKLEWIIERDVTELPSHESIMPWARVGEEDERYRRSLAAALLLSLLLGLLLPMINLPLPEPWQALDIPERLTRLIRDQRTLPPPLPVRQETKPELKEPEPTQEVVAEEVSPQPAKQSSEKPSAASKGILAFREKFSGLAAVKAPSKLGSQARITSSGDAAIGRTQRSMVTTQAPGSSGGINLASLSREVGGGAGGQIAGVQVARATSTIGGGTGEDRPLSGGPSVGRTDEEIQIVFDRHKAALYRLYNRELRRDPTLMGQILLRFRIEPDGSVSLCELQSTDMNAPELSAQVVERVRTFDFGAKEVSAVTVLYPIDFLPAT
jgi:hypothetical protein